jgi:peptidoglycan-associated lipoprotein
MNRLTVALVAGTALMAAGCAKKRPETLPPAPVGTEGTIPAAEQADPSGGAIVPGSDADFRRSVSSNTINFGLDQSDVDDAARSILDSQVQWLSRYPAKRVTLEGHCDERGTREYNLALGERRANSAKNYLVSRGVAAARITTVSYGKERPLALGSDEESYAQNRRAVTVVLN